MSPFSGGGTEYCLCCDCVKCKSRDEQLSAVTAERDRYRQALERIVEPPKFEIDGNEAAVALRMNLIAHKALSDCAPLKGEGHGQ